MKERRFPGCTPHLLLSLLEINPALWLKVGRKGTREIKIGRK